MTSLITNNRKKLLEICKREGIVFMKKDIPMLKKEVEKTLKEVT